MADLQTVVIDPSKIKVRWEEPYTSESVNRAHTAIQRGVYRGYIVSPAATPDQTFRLAYDPSSSGIYVDNALMYHDQANGFGAFVRDSAEPSFDMSARFSSGGAIPGGGEKWWVWADVDYATGLTTTGDYHVTLDGDPIPDDAIIFGTLEFSGGETTIQQANCSTDDATVPFPTKREDGAYVAGDQIYGWLSGEEAWNVPSLTQKRGLNAAPTTPSTSNPFVTKADTLDRYFGEPHFYPFTGLSAVRKVQLSGYFYVGSTNSEAVRYFSLRDSSDKRKQLSGTSNGERIYIDSIYKSDDSGALDPSTDADSEGFYQNPYVYLRNAAGAYVFTGDLTVYCFRKKQFSTLEQAPVQAFPDGGMDYWPHSDEVKVEAASGSPDSLSMGMAQDALEELLGLANARIKTIHPTASATAPVLLWRSSAKTLDTSVDRNTSSMYWLNGRFFIILGGYLSSATEITAGTGIGNVVMFQLNQSGIDKFVKDNPTAATSWAYATLTNWDSLYTQDEETHLFGGDLSIANFLKLAGGENSKIEGALTGTTDMFKFFESTNPASTAKVRVLYGGGSSASISITYNADWDNTNDEWVADVSDGTEEASAIVINSQGVTAYMMEDGQVLASGGTWSLWATYGMSKNLAPGGAGSNRTWACDSVSGDNLRETIRFGWVGMASLTGTAYFGDVCNFRSRWESAPSVGEFTFGSPSENVKGGGSFGTLSTGNIMDIDNYGFRVQVGSSVNDGDICRYDNTITIAT